jgi:hypothetical protein
VRETIVAERKTTKTAANADKSETATTETIESGKSNSEATQAAPLAAPEDKPRRLGHPESSTNFVAANAALRSVPGANHRRLLDFDGNDLDPEQMFVFPEAESPSMLATVRKAIYEEFTYPNASTPTTHLLYPAEAKVPVEQALKLRDALRLQAEEPDPVPPISA